MSTKDPLESEYEDYRRRLDVLLDTGAGTREERAFLTSLSQKVDRWLTGPMFYDCGCSRWKVGFGLCEGNSISNGERDHLQEIEHLRLV